MSGSRQKQTDSSSEEARAESEEAQQRGEKAPGTSRVEWVVAAISGLVVACAIGFLIYDAASVPPSPPVIELQVDTTVAVTGGYLVQFTAHNTGATTAANVQVEGSLSQDTTRVETSQTTLDYVPIRSTRKAGLFFSRDPRSYRLELRPKGYTQP